MNNSTEVIEISDITGCDEIEAVIAGVVKDDIDHVEKYDMELDNIRRNGVLLDMDIHGLSVFSAVIDWGDIGVQDDTTIKRLRRSSKFLYDVEIYKRIESKAQSMRNLLVHYSRLGKMFYPYRWVPLSEYPLFSEKFNLLKQDFNALRDQAADPQFHERAKKAIIKDFTEMASKNWKEKISSKSANVLFYRGAACSTEKAYIEVMVQEALDKMPSIIQIQDLCVSLRFARACAKTEIEMDALAADRVRHQRELEEARKKAEQYEIYLKNADAQNEVQHRRTMQELEFEKKRIEIEKVSLQDAIVREEVARLAREQLAREINPALDAVRSLSEGLMQDLSEIIESIKENDYVAPTIARKSERLLDVYRVIGELGGDKKLLNLLEQVKSSVQSGEYKGRKHKTMDELVQTIESARAVASQQAIKATKTSRFSIL